MFVSLTWNNSKERHKKGNAKGGLGFIVTMTLTVVNFNLWKGAVNKCTVATPEKTVSELKNFDLETTPCQLNSKWL